MLPKNQTLKLCLSSHPGKGLVLKDKFNDRFSIGYSQNALKVTLQYTNAGHCFIKYNRHGGIEGYSLECAMGKYHEGNKVTGYRNH